MGEGLLWSVREQALYWVEILARQWHRWEPASHALRRWTFAEEISALAERVQAPGLIVALRRGFALFDPAADTEPRYLHQPEPERTGNRFNDGKCDAQGRFWAGSMAYAVTPHAGTLYRLDGAREVRPKFRRLTLSNGIGCSPDDTLMYLIDSQSPGGPTLTVFDFDAARGRQVRARLIGFAAVITEEPIRGHGPAADDLAETGWSERDAAAGGSGGQRWVDRIADPQDR